jgi:multiple antibiotic resistance protein
VDTVSAAIMLLLIMDPVGNIPLFLPLLKNIAPARQRYILIRELLIALGAMLLILFLGKEILALLSLKQQSISVAGGIVLFLIALRMIFHESSDSTVGDKPREEPLIVPIAIPLIAGPSTFATLLLLVSREPGRRLDWLMALLLAWTVTAVIVLASTGLHRVLGERGLTAVERLMGMLLVIMAVQMFLDGLAEYLAR